MKGATPADLVLRRRAEISIHAPVKGATAIGAVTGKMNANFNPRTREGCDRRPVHGGQPARDFNPRTREGCDTGSTSGCSIETYFNPRTREGCDLVDPLRPGAGLCISIHAPVKGATCKGASRV